MLFHIAVWVFLRFSVCVFAKVSVRACRAPVRVSGWIGVCDGCFVGGS